MEKRTAEGKAAKYSYITQWKKDNIDQLKIELPKGGRDIIKQNAAKRGKSTTQYIIDAVDYYEENQ